MDIAETDKSYILKIELPEVNQDDVKISVENGVLTIKGERTQEKEEKGKKFHLVERYSGAFQRSFSLPANADERKIDAIYKDGMLTAELRKTPETKPTPLMDTLGTYVCALR